MAKDFWEDVYLGAEKTGGISTSAKTFLATDIGAGLGECALPVTNHPNFGIGKTHRVVEKDKGVLAPTPEYVFTRRLPATSFTFEVDAKTLAFFMRLFFQSGVEEIAGLFYHLFYPPENSTCIVWATLCRRLSQSAAESQVLDGVICRSFTISGSAGQAITCSVDLLGRTLSNSFDWDAQSSVATFPAKEVCLFKDIFFCLGGISSGDLVSIDSFSLSVSNNAFPLFYNGEAPYEFRLGRYSGNITVTIPFNADYKLQGSDTVTGMFWFIGGGTYHVMVWFTGVVTGVEEIESGELGTKITLDLIDSQSMSIPGIKMMTWDEVQRL